MRKRSFGELAVVILFGLLFIAVSAIIRGIVMQKAWLWFMVEPFGMPSIGIAHMIGLSICIGLMALNFKQRDKSMDEIEGFDAIAKKFKDEIIESLAYSLSALTAAWAAKLFM